MARGVGILVLLVLVLVLLGVGPGRAAVVVGSPADLEQEAGRLEAELAALRAQTAALRTDVAARREALAADLVVINHHLFFADLNVRESGVAELLPSVHAVVFDEAHQLNEIGVQFLGRQLGTGQLSSVCGTATTQDVDSVTAVPWAVTRRATATTGSVDASFPNMSPAITSVWLPSVASEVSDAPLLDAVPVPITVIEVMTGAR